MWLKVLRPGFLENPQMAPTQIFGAGWGGPCFTGAVKVRKVKGVHWKDSGDYNLVLAGKITFAIMLETCRRTGSLNKSRWQHSSQTMRWPNSGLRAKKRERFSAELPQPLSSI